jgi:hypothetical protein
MTELTKKMEKVIKEVLWDYHWNVKYSNRKENMYMENLAQEFPHLNREALKDVGKYKDDVRPVVKNNRISYADVPEEAEMYLPISPDSYIH